MSAASVTSPLQDGRFLMLGRAGRGGMGEVHRAFDRKASRLVALKVQRDAEATRGEFAALSRLDHPNVVRAYELATAHDGPLAGGTPYLVLEHLEGLPAHRALRPGRTDPAILVNVAVALLRALLHVHRAGLVHRDLKPANVVVSRNGRRLDAVKLTDFGLAVPKGRAGRPGKLTGSVFYVAPEALIGAPLDGRADLYALGLLLYRLATGETAVPATDVHGAVRWHLSGPAADPSRLRPKLPERLVALIRRLTVRERERRPEGADEALAMLGVEETWRGRSWSRIA